MAEPTENPSRVVAIVGTAISSRDEANYQPPEVERWGLGNAYVYLNQIDRYFELHDKQFVMTTGRHGKKTGPTQTFWEYWHYLQKAGIPVYMQDVTREIKNSVRYPIEDIIADFGPYLTSSVAYMLALAIHEKFDEIRLFGVDMATKMEFSHQRDGCEYLIGIARGRGMTVTIPDSSPLLKAPLYGRSIDPMMTIDTLQGRKMQLEAKEKIAEAQLVSLRAQVEEVEYWIDQVQNIIPGSTIPAGEPVILDRSKFGPKSENGQKEAPVEAVLAEPTDVPPNG